MASSHRQSLSQTPGLLFAPWSGHNNHTGPHSRTRGPLALLDLPPGVPPMAGLTPRNLLPLTCAALALLALSPPAPACPFCATSGTTLTGDLTDAKFVIYGKPINATPGLDAYTGTTEI